MLVIKDIHRDDIGLESENFKNKFQIFG